MHVVRYTCKIYCLILALTIPVGDTEMHERSNNLPVQCYGKYIYVYICAMQIIGDYNNLISDIFQIDLARCPAT